MVNIEVEAWKRQFYHQSFGDPTIWRSKCSYRIFWTQSWDQTRCKRKFAIVDPVPKLMSNKIESTQTEISSQENQNWMHSVIPDNQTLSVSQNIHHEKKKCYFFHLFSIASLSAYFMIKVNFYYNNANWTKQHFPFVVCLFVCLFVCSKWLYKLWECTLEPFEIRNTSYFFSFQLLAITMSHHIENFEFEFTEKGRNVQYHVQRKLQGTFWMECHLTQTSKTMRQTLFKME